MEALRVIHLFDQHKELLVWLGVASIVMFAGSLVLIPFLCVRLREDFLLSRRPPPEARFASHHPVLRWTLLFLKNVAGLLIFLAGVAMLFLPGQGVLTMIMGVLMLDFPGKRAFEIWLISRPVIFKGINKLRHRAGAPPLMPAEGIGGRGSCPGQAH